MATIVDAKRDEAWMAYYDKAARDSYNRQLEMQTIINDYNTPSNQRQRLDDAGLNSAAVLSGGIQNVSSPVPQAPQSNGGPTGSTPPISLDSVADTMIKLAQVDKLHAEADLVDVEARERAFDLGYNQYYKSLGYDRALDEATIENIKMDTSSKSSDISYKKAQTDSVAFDNKIKDFYHKNGYYTSIVNQQKIDEYLKGFDKELKSKIASHPKAMDALAWCSAFGLSADSAVRVIDTILGSALGKLPNLNLGGNKEKHLVPGKGKMIKTGENTVEWR